MPRSTIVTFFSVLLGFHSNWQTLMSAACPTSARMANASTQKDLTPVNATAATPSLGEANAKVTRTHKRPRTHRVTSTAQSCTGRVVVGLGSKLPGIKTKMYFPRVRARKKTVLSP